MQQDVKLGLGGKHGEEGNQDTIYVHQELSLATRDKGTNTSKQ
jgi:hypothetical protein